MDSTPLRAPAARTSASLYALPVPVRPPVAAQLLAPAFAFDGSNDSAAPVACRRLLLTLLFTDIVGSTRMVERLGDRGWHGVLRRHRAIVRAQIARLGGAEVDCCGDGFFAVFPGPAIAIHCAAAACRALPGEGIEIRAGVHAGECDFEAGGRVSGIAVHVAARIASLARPREILVSDTVKDLVAGSGLEFADRGRRTLKGLSGSRRLYALHEAVVPTGAPRLLAADRPRPSA